MKISELIAYRQHPIYKKAKRLLSKSAVEKAKGITATGKRQSQYELFTNFLEKYGFEEVGSGVFGIVYEKQNYPWIFKIFQDDPAYKRFIEYAMKNQHIPYLPKVKGKLIKINDNTYAIRLEKLSAFNLVLHPELEKLFDILRKSDKSSDIPKKDVEWLESNYPGIVNVLNYLSKDKTDVFDIHAGNIMLRGKTPVLVDPIINLRSS